MITGIDHVVIAVADLDRAVSTYQKLGFTVVEGGRHPFGSYNALIAFADDSYIELLGFYEPSPAHPWWDLLHERGGGLIDFCMASDDIGRDHQAFLAQGVPSSDLVEGGRSRPDGYYVKWLNNKVGGDYQGLIPFIIEDVTPRIERLPRARQQANGVIGIDCISLASADLARYAAPMAAVLGQAGRPIADEALGAAGLRFELGGQALEYLAPTRASGPLAAHLAAKRPAPYRISFKTTGAAATFGPEATEGLRIALL